MASSPSTAIRKLTESGLARELGVSRQAVHDLVKRGILTKDKDGLIDVEMAKIALMNRVRPSSKTSAALQPDTAPATPQAAEPQDGTEATSYHVAKTLREAAEAQIARLKLAEMQGELIRVAAVKSTLATVFATTRDALLQIPARLAPLLAADTDPASVQNTLHAEIHQALHHLAGAPDRIGQTEAAVE
ncbi:MAG: hypothetical protein ACRECD_01195 [Burkholderiaceae bacterium]